MLLPTSWGPTSPSVRCTHNELVDVPQAAEHQVGDVLLVLVPVLVGGVDVRDAGALDQGDALVARALGHKQHGGLVRLDGATPACQRTTQRDAPSADLHASFFLSFFYLFPCFASLLQRQPEGEGVLLGVHDVSVLAPLPVQLLVVHLRELGAQGPPGVGVVATAHQVQAARAVAAGLPPHRDL